jgi:demethylmenaquinone methyltransferase/2-methoxy-6-polyprenyl-1,4-benzoquinol methylase
MINADVIRSMFTDVAPRYDIANSFLSGGIHHYWRRKLVRFSGAGQGDRILDCATGTGDLAIEFAKHVGASGQVVASDFCDAMVSQGPKKAAAAKVFIKFLQDDAMNLKQPDASFDCVCISFGIRNVADPKKALSEMHRVLKPGGVLMVLEFGKSQSPVVAPFFKFYSRHVLPRIGGLVTGYESAYRYLEESSSEFPCRDDFTELMAAAGNFLSLEWRPLSFGIAYMYKGVKG